MPMIARIFGDTAAPVRVPLASLNAPIVQSATFNFSPTVFNGTNIGTLSVAGAGPITWAITAGNGGGNFAINSSTGLITAAANISTPQTFSLTIRATNIVGVGTATATINILAPPAVQNATFNLATPLSNGEFIGTMTATGATPITWSITAGNDAGDFTINSTTGQITAVAVVSTTQTFSLTVQATNVVGSSTGTATINLLAPPAVQNATFSPVATVSSGTVIGTMTATGATPLTWAITAGNGPGTFAINPGTGQITAAVNISTAQNFSLTIQATNSVGSSTGTATINVQAAPAVQSTTFTRTAPVSSGTAIGTMTATGSTPITWAITAGNIAGTFSINSSTGLITTNFTISTALTFSLTIQATNIIGVGTGTATIIVQAVPTVQDATFNPGSPVSNGTVIGTMTASGTTPFTWAITAGNGAGDFAINSSTGVITATTAVANQNFSLTVQATNVAGSGTGTATINVPAAGSGIISVNLSGTSLTNIGAQNAGALIGAVTVTTSPPGGTPVNPITISGPDASRFALTNGGFIPCNLVVGTSDLPAGSYSITLNATT